MSNLFKIPVPNAIKIGLFVTELFNFAFIESDIVAAVVRV